MIPRWLGVAPLAGMLAVAAVGAHRARAVDPGGDAAFAQDPSAAMGQAADFTAREIEIESTRVLARVGTEVILAGDVATFVNEAMASRADQVPESQREAFRQYVTLLGLQQLIQSRMILCELKSQIPPENYARVLEDVARRFDELELPGILENMQLASAAQLDAVLRRAGSSLARERQAFAERMLAREWVRGKINDDEEVTHEQMLDYYREHLADYEFTAKARWEQLTSAPGDEGQLAALDALIEAGNRVVDGATFAQAAAGGPRTLRAVSHDWTTPGSLKSTLLDRAVFELPVASLSPILEDERGFHIVRVVERTPGGCRAFDDVQSEIRERIKKERMNAQAKEYLTRLRARIPVWTAFDDVPETAAALRSEPTQRRR